MMIQVSRNHRFKFKKMNSVLTLKLKDIFFEGMGHSGLEENHLRQTITKQTLRGNLPCTVLSLFKPLFCKVVCLNWIRISYKGR